MTLRPTSPLTFDPCPLTSPPSESDVARPAGLEPATYGFEVRRSIQLSYGRNKRSSYHSQLCSMRSSVSRR